MVSKGREVYRVPQVRTVNRDPKGRKVCVDPRGHRDRQVRMVPTVLAARKVHRGRRETRVTLDPLALVNLVHRDPQVSYHSRWLTRCPLTLSMTPSTL